jgi:uncharacterized protein (DUF1501 family)
MNLGNFERRAFLRGVSAAGLFGASLSGWTETLAAVGAGRKHKACIVLFMDGGPSHKDTFDMKPGTPDAGELKPIKTSVPGVQVCELFPETAKQMRHAAVLRSMSTPENDHIRARYHLHTGYRQRAGGLVYPALGAIASHELSEAKSPLPGYVYARGSGGRSYGTASGFLGARYQPLVVHHADRGLANSKPAVPVETFDRRVKLLGDLEYLFNAQSSGTAARAHTTTFEQSVALMRSAEVAAFDLSREPAAVREAYGNNDFGDGCLLARRLVETGVPFVEVSSGGWDHHGGIYNRKKGGGREGIHRMAGEVDRGMAALIADLKNRGMLDDVLVVWMGEFGRTPKINKGAGRDHYSKAWSTVLAGGGIRGGQVIGRTDAEGAEVVDRPISAIDFMATVCRIVGIDPNKELPSPGARPIPIVDNQQKVKPLVVSELF